jgi:hypothetical protein
MSNFLKILFALPIVNSIISFAVMYIFILISYHISENLGMILSIILGGAWGIFFGAAIAYKIVDDGFAMVAGFFAIILIVGGSYFYLDYYKKEAGQLKANIHLNEAINYKSYKYFRFLDAEILTSPIGHKVKKYQNKDSSPSFTTYVVAPMKCKRENMAESKVWYCLSYSGKYYRPEIFKEELETEYRFYVQTNLYKKPLLQAIERVTGKDIKSKDVILLEGIKSPKAAKNQALKDYLLFLGVVNIFWIVMVLGYYGWLGWKWLKAKMKR